MSTGTLISDELGSALRNAIQRYSSAPDGTTTAVFKADTRLLHNLLSEARIRQFTLQVDEPPSLGGSNQAPNPVELVLAALGTCQEIVYAVYAAVLGIELDELEITVTGPLDPRGFFGLARVPVGFSHIEMQTHITSRASVELIQGLANAVQAHCPVLDVLQRPLEVRNRIELNGLALLNRT
jgi:uncharacterized OsmC-like protein